MKTRNMCLAGLMAALLCLLGPMSIPVGTVPFSPIGFGIYLCGAVLGSRQGMRAVLVYILLGTSGIPVFSGATGGAAHLIGPTGGFIAGYIPCALLSGMGKGKAWPGMAAGTLAMYGMGTMWFMLQTGTALVPALTGCVLPFIGGDILKIAAANAVARAIKQALNISENK